MNSPIRYSGGKTRAVKHILPFLKTNELVSPFIGGASLEINAAIKGIKVLGFDLFDILVNYWKIQLNNPHELYNSLKIIEPTQESYDRIKSILRKWDKSQNMFSLHSSDYYKEEPIQLSDLEGAAYYWFNHNLSYGPMYLGWASSAYLKPKKYQSLIEKVRDFKCPNLIVEQGSFEDVIPSYNKSFMYLDPPYYLDKDGDNKMYKGLYPNPNFDVHHRGFNHEKLRDLLYNHKGSFVLSYNNCETIREWYKDFDLYYPEWSYSMGNGESRIGETRKDSGSIIKKSHEILIVKLV